MEYHLGVDLGTTYTAAAVWVNGRVDIVRLGGRRAEIPSLVFVGADGPVLIGEVAERRGVAEPARLAREFKRRVGDPVPAMVGGSPYSAHSLMARLLQQVMHIVIAHQQGPPAAVTVTHPANWGPYKRELFQQAVHLADLDRVALRTEPEAAAVRYAAGERVQPGEVVAVYDLGGGTFDAAVLRKTDTGFVLLGEPEGIEHLGGIDFDEAVYAHVMTTLGNSATGLDAADEQAIAAVARLRRDCREAKEALSFDTDVTIPVALPGLHTQVRLNRSEFEAMITPALRDTIAALRRALRRAGVAPTDLKAILLAGGSSRIPLVGQLLAADLDRPVVLDPDPEHSVAVGAALMTAPATPAASRSTSTAGTSPDPRTDPTVAAELPVVQAVDDVSGQATTTRVSQPAGTGPDSNQHPTAVAGTAQSAARVPEPLRAATTGTPEVDARLPQQPSGTTVPGSRPARVRRVGALLAILAVIALIGTAAAIRYRVASSDRPDAGRSDTADDRAPDNHAGSPSSEMQLTAQPGGPTPSPTAGKPGSGSEPSRARPPTVRNAPPPRTTRRQQPFLLIEHAAQATWRSGAGVLPFPGQAGDSRGGSAIEAYVLEDGSAPTHLTTHPEWVDHGWITGDFSVPGSIMDGDHFRATVGFVVPASGTSAGEVDFVVIAVSRSGRATELDRIRDAGRDGAMHTLDINLTRVRGYTTIRIRADAGASAAQDWAAWVNPRIER